VTAYDTQGRPLGSGWRITVRSVNSRGSARNISVDASLLGALVTSSGHNATGGAAVTSVTLTITSVSWVGGGARPATWDGHAATVTVGRP